MQPKALWALGVAAVAGLGIVAAVSHTASVDPVNGERTQAKSASASTSDHPSPASEPDYADKRWRQRIDERLANRAAIDDTGAPGTNHGAGAFARPGDGGAVPGAGSRNSNDAPGSTVPGSTGTEASLRDGQRVGGITGPIVNARLGTGVTAPAAADTGASAAKGSTGTTSSTLGSTPSGTVAVPRGCGDGVLEAGEECEPASSPKCGDDCTILVSDACYDCEVNSVCVPLASGCTDFITDKLGQSRCFDVEHCIQDTGCAGGDNTLTNCFCGGLGMDQCASAPDGGDTAPHGACSDVIRDAMGPGATNRFVLTHYTSNTTPAGIAIKRFQCLKTTPTCGPACFPKTGVK